MPIPVITPKYYPELADKNSQLFVEEADRDIFVTAATVEYVMYLSNKNFTRKLIQMTEPIEYMMGSLKPEDEAKIQPLSDDIRNKMPLAQYYWVIRMLMMNILQNKSVIFEKRLLLLNYALKTIYGMVDKHQENMIPSFTEQFTQMESYDDTLNYFSEIKAAPHFSLSDGISLLKALDGKSIEYKEVVRTIYSNLGISGPETLNMVDFQKYLQYRTDFANNYMLKNSHILENIMINYVWTHSIPFAAATKLNIWDNYTLFCAIYNAIKVMITCYMPGKTEDDLVKAVSAFDKAFRDAGEDMLWKLVAAVKNAGQDNNGDLAILVTS